ncbi:hypothetical protein [Hydrogenophaga sp. 2FB]|uniref:hypothetical protein n=1 Tax=Hydrogenophaga sp. 2FB TaxID=2502187 RepID=UPI0010F5CF9F|nr:hypothetical protein [Hydrogenophaga sp. 2FB]
MGLRQRGGRTSDKLLEAVQRLVHAKQGILLRYLNTLTAMAGEKPRRSSPLAHRPDFVGD